MKRFLALALSLVMLLTLCPTVLAEETEAAAETDVTEETVLPAEEAAVPAVRTEENAMAALDREEISLTSPLLGATKAGRCGEDTWVLDTTTWKVTLTGVNGGSTGNFQTHKSPLWEYYQNITSVEIGEGVKEIGENVFQSCYKIKNVTFTGGDLVRIGGFSECSGLTSLTIPDGVTTIGSAAFSHCKGLTSVTIPDSVTTICDNAFYGCTGLTDLTIPDSVTTISSYAFSGCTGLTSLTIPDSVTTIGGHAFGGCEKLTRVNISDLAAWCGIDFGDEWTNPLLYAKALYLNGEQVTALVIPGGVTAIGKYAFHGDTSLTSVFFPLGIQSVGENAFNGCTGVASVRYSGTQEQWKTVQIASGNSPITGRTPTYNATMPGYYRVTAETGLKDGTLYFCADGMRYKDLAQIKQGTVVSVYAAPAVGYTVSNFLVDGKAIQGNTFELQKDVTISAVFAKSYELYSSGYSGTCGADGADVNWAIDKNKVIHIFGVGDMKSYNANNYAPWYRYYKSAFSSVVIEPGVTMIGGCAFYDCPGVTSVTIPDTVTIIGGSAFSGCTGLTDLTIPDSVTGIASYAFSGCTGLTDLTIPAGVTVIDRSTFEGCTGLTSVTMPNSVTRIGIQAFLGCTALTAITIPSNVTYIENNAFYNCTKLASITIPAGASFGSGVFTGCNVLKDVVIKGNVDIQKYRSYFPAGAVLSCITTGDLNGSGGTDIQDMAYLFTWLSQGLNSGKLTGTAFLAAIDVNGDSAVDILDYQALYEIVKRN